MNRTEAIQYLSTHTGVLRTKEILKAGIQPRTLYKLRDDGIVDHLSYGVYKYHDDSTSSHSIYIELCQRIPKAVFCLISALHFHEIGTQLPYDQWIALPQKVKKPRVREYNIQYIYPQQNIYELGLEEHQTEGTSVKVYSPTKTVVDCFKYRNKIGLDVALEALKESLRLKKTTRKELIYCATKCRMKNIMMPYLESI
jgi:predicted transcriptional regulator of viral defense system